MAGKSVKKHGVTTRQLVDKVPEGCSLPDFEQKPVTMALAEGRNAILRAVVCGEPAPQVRWQSSQGDLSNSSKYQLLSAPGSREHALQINKLTGEDTDKYYCVAVNPYGEAVCSARLTVIEVGFRKKRKRNTEPQEDLSKELMDLRRMLRKSAPPPKKKMDPEQVWQLLMSADRKDYERLCIQYGIADFRGMLRKLEKMRRERDDRMAQYVNAVSNTKQMKVTKEGVAFFELDLDLKDPESNVYLYKDGEMVPYSSESQAKRSVRRLGKHYHFQIQDLWPEDAGLYQVKVEDAEVFSTELEASAIPPRVLVPLSEARCEERGDAVFACTLSNPCPQAAWHFKHQPLQPSDKYEASVSPDGLTHQLVVRGARLSDMGPYSLDTGLHVSSAWLVVETGQDQGPLTTSADHQAQGQGAPASDAKESRRASGQRGVPRERGGAPGGAGWDPGRQLPAGLDGGGLGGHSYPSMGGEGAAGAAWGPGQAGKGFLEADRFAATVSGDNQLHGERGWDTSLPGGPQSQGEGVGSGLGLTGGHELDGGRDGDGDRGGGPVGGWGAGGLGGHGEGQEDSGDSRGQLWGAQLGPGTGKGALQGSRSGPAGSGAGGEGMASFLQGESLGGGRGEDALSRERGSGAAWGAGGSGAGLGGSGDSSVAGGPGALGSPGSEAGRGPGSWGSRGRGDEDSVDARGLGGPWLSPGQMPAGQGSQGPAIPGVQDPLRGRGGPEGSRQEGGPGGPGGWGGEGQGPGPWGDMGSSLSQAGAHPGPGGGRGGVGGTQAPGLMGSGQGGDGSSHGLMGAPGRGAQGPWGTQGGTEGAGGPGAMGSGPDFWNGAQSSGEGGPRGEGGAEAGLVGSQYGDGSGYFRGTGPGSGAGSGEGSRAPGEAGSAWGVGAPGGAEAEEGGAYRGGSGGPGGGGGEEAGVRPETWGATSGGPGEAGPGGRRRPSGGLETSATMGAGGEGHVGADPGAKGAPGGGWADGFGGPGATEPGSLRAGGGGGGEGGWEGTRGLSWDQSGRPKAQGPGSRPGSDRGHRDGPGILGPQHHGGGGSGGPGSGGMGPAGEAGFRDGSGGLGGIGSGSEAGHRDRIGGVGGMGSGSEAGHRDRIGGVGGMGSGSEAGYKDGIGGVGGMGSGSEAGYKDGIGGVGGMGSGAQAGHRDGLGAPGGMGSGAQAGHRDGIGGVGGMGSGAQAGYKDGIGGVGGMGSGAQAGYKDGIGGVGGMGSGAQAGYKDGIGGVGGMGSGVQAGHRDGIGGVGGMGSGAQAGYKDGIGGVGGMGSGAQAGYKDGIGGVGGMGSGAQAGYKDGIGGVGGMGSESEAGHRDGLGAPGGMGSGAQAGYKDGIGGLGGMGSGSEAGHRDGLGAPGGMGSGAQAGYKDGIGGVGGMGSGSEAGHRDGLGAPGGMGSGAQAGYKDGIGGVGGMGSGAQAGHRDGLGAPGGMGSGAQAGYKDGIGGVGGMGSGAQAGHRDGLGAPGGMGSGAQAGYKDGIGGVGGMGSGAQAGHRDGLGAPGGVGSGAQAGPKDGFGGSGGVGSGLEAGHRGGPGGSGETGLEGEWGSGGGPRRCGAAGALASVGQEGGPKGREAGGPGAGSGAASEGPYGGPSSEGGRAPGLVNGAGPGVGSGLPGAVGASGSASSGAPGAPGDRGAPSGKGGSAGQAGGVGAPGCLDGPGAVEGEAWAGAGALGSRREKGSGNAGAGAGTADRGGAAVQGGPGPQGAGDSLLGGGGVAAASGTGTGEAQDGGRRPGQRGKSASASADGPGVSRARAPGRGDQGFEGGRAGAGSQPPGSGVDDAAFGGTQESGGPRDRAGAAGPGEAGGRQGPGVRDSRGSGARSRRPAGPRDVDGAGSGLDGPLGSKDSGDRPTDVGGPGAPPGRGRRGGRGPLGAEADKVPTEDEAPRGSRSRTRAGATAGGAERRAQEEAGGRGPLPGAEDGAEDTGSSGETPREDGSRAGSRRGGAEGRLGGGGQGQDAPRSPRGRHKIGTGCFCEEARAPQGHFSRELADTEARLGEAATLSCTLSRDLGPGAWFKDGVQLSAQDGLVFEQEGLVRRLLIAHAQGTHAGRYSFVAGDQKSEATLTVRDPPVIAPDVMERLQEPLVVKAGKPLSVKIAFESRLPVQAAWTKDGAAVDGAGGRGAQVALGDGFARLCVPSASRRDSGQYSVTLRSQGGSVQARLTLHVIDKPQPPQGPLEVQDCRGAGVCLRWGPPRDDGGRAVEHYVVERRQAGRSTWLKVGEPPADATSFTDAQVEQGKKYAFRVRVVTSEGPGEALESEEVLVAPEARPGPPSAPAILSASSQSITLSWTAPRGPGSAHILGYLVDKRKKGSNTWAAVTEQPVPERRWTVTDLRPDCQYEFRVTAVAPAGPGQPGPPSDPVFARDPMRPPGPVRELQVTDTSHTSISLRWAPPDTQDADEAQGYVVELCPSDSLEWAPCHAGTVPGTTYTAKGLRPREGYFVRVVAVNDGGRGQPAALDVVVQAMPAQVSPRFLVDSSATDTLVVRVGDTIRVPVRFEAAPLPEVTWLKDGLPLSQRSVTSTKDGLTQLLVPVAGLSDSGLYCVVLRGPQGQEATHTFALRVAARPQAPGPVHLQENVPGTVTAEWEPSPDEARGVPLHYAVLMRSAAHGPWREVADRVHTTRFTFLGVVPGHEYHFRVVAKNELGASEPSDAGQPWCLPRLRDKVPAKPASYREPDRSQKPWFLVGLRSHLLPAGCECCMSCAVRGCPPPRVTWFRNGESLEGRRGAYSTDTLGVCSLVIPGVGPEDSGLYKAVAENALGQAVSTATLLVTDPSS